MARPYTILLPGGGSITSNANSAAAALENAKQQTPELNWASGGGGQVSAGGHQGNTATGQSEYGAGQTAQSFNAPVGQLGGTPGGNTSVNLPGVGQVTGASSGAIDAFLQAVADGNVAAQNEAIRQFNVIHKNDDAAFAQTAAVNAANIAAQRAGLTGTFEGQPTEAARQFNVTSGLQALKQSADLQPNAFRQAQALYGLGQGGFTPLMAAAAGMGPAVTSFQAPTLSAADTASLGWLASQTGTGSYTQDQSQHWMNTLPGPQAVNWTAVQQAGPGAVDLVTKGLAAKWGLSEPEIQNIARQSLPGFSAPTLAGAFKG